MFEIYGISRVEILFEFMEGEYFGIFAEIPRNCSQTRFAHPIKPS